jgi:hypothetical protein
MMAMCSNIRDVTDQGMVVLQDCSYSQKYVTGSHSEAYGTHSHDEHQAVNIKVEEFSDTKVGDDPAPMACVKIKVENKVEFSDVNVGDDHAPVTCMKIKVENKVSFVSL